MIEYVDGHWRSVRTRKENSDLLEKDLGTLSPEEQVAINYLLAELSDPSKETKFLNALGELEWVRTPVDIERFCKDPYYLGNTCDSIYPVWLEALKEIFDGGYREAIFTGSIGCGKCVHPDTEVYDVSSGRRRKVSEFGEFHITSMDSDGKLVPELATAFPSKVKSCLRVELRGGQSIILSEDHPVFTGRGWVRADSLVLSDLVATPRRYPEPFEVFSISDDTLSLVAFLLAGKLSFDVMDAHVRLVDEFVRLADRYGVGTKGVQSIIRRYRLGGKLSHRRVPAEFYGLSSGQVALFLNRFFGCVGSVQICDNDVNIEVVLDSEMLVDDLRFMLCRLGVLAKKSLKRSGCGTDAWSLSIESSEHALLFLSVVGDLFSRESVCQEARSVLSVVEPNKDVGLISVFSSDAGTDIFWDGVKSIECVGCMKLCDVSVPSTSCFVGNGIVVHNTFAASIGICRLLYVLSCMRDPQKSFGLAANSNMSICCLSVNEVLATKVAYENIATKVEASPYFQEHFPFEKTKKELRFPKHIWVAARASNDGSVLGLNIISCLLDETNFMPQNSGKNRGPQFVIQDRAEVLYDAIQRRTKSRFSKKGKFPGIMFVVSSKQTKNDFTARRIKQSIKDSTVYVCDFSLWDVRPHDYEGDDWFHVIVGNEQSPSRIVGEDEDIDALKLLLPEDCVVIRVPDDFRPDFESNLEGAIRDLAGVSTVAVSPYIQIRSKIVEAIRPSLSHPFSVEVYDPSKPGDFYWNKMVRKDSAYECGVAPILNPHAPRHIHIDPSMTKDCTGIAMGHVAGFTEVVKKDGDGNKFSERAPEILIDFMLRIVPPVGGEILFGNLRKFVYQLSRRGYVITCVSVDSWNSADTVQKLNQRGFNSIVLSVDRTLGPYDLLKSALYENRLFYYDYPPLLEELRELEYDRVKRKVDHPVNGCFVGFTRIPLLDGTHPCISDLVDCDVWVYSARSDGTVVPGLARGRMSGVRAEFVDVILDSGAVERCTPEHLWMLRDGTYKEASCLRPGIDRLMPVNRQWPVNGGYERISDRNRVKLLTHHAVWVGMTGQVVPEEYCVHHLNGVKTDNRPENLKLMLKSDHLREHTGRRHREDAEWRARLYEGARRFNESAEGRRKHALAAQRTAANRTREDFLCSARKNPNFRSDIDASALEKVKDDPEAVNANAVARILGCGRNVVIRVLRELGFSTWDEFLAKDTGDNHKVRDVVFVKLDEPVPVYDLEVKVHSNFALSSGVFVHNSKDVSDAVAGVVWTLTENSSSLPLSFLRNAPSCADMWLEEHQQAAMASNYGSSDVSDMSADSMVLPPFLIGSGNSWDD